MFQQELQRLTAGASVGAVAGDPNGGGGSAEGEVQSYHAAASAGGLVNNYPCSGVPGTMVAYPPGLPADGRGGGAGGESTSESLSL